MSDGRDSGSEEASQEYLRPAPLVALVLVSAAWLAYIWATKTLFLRLMPDDAYYYLKTAVNIAAGYGPTFDLLNATNGFHPLWMALLVPVASVCGDDMDLFTQVVLTGQIGLVILGTLILARNGLFGRGMLVWVAVAMLASFYGTKVLVNGVEAAIEYLLLCAALTYWWRVTGPGEILHVRNAVVLGFLAGLVTLARLDAVVFSVVLLLMPLIWPQRPFQATEMRERLTECVIGLAAFGVVLIPYLAWNVVSFGHLMPVNVSIKAGPPFAFTPPGIAAAAVIFVCVLTFRFMGEQWVPERRRLFPLVVLVGLQGAILLAAKGMAIPPPWYFVPHLLLIMLVLSVFLQRVVLRVIPRKLPALAAVGYTLLLVFSCVRATDSLGLSARTVRRDAGRWLSSNTSPDAIIAGWNAGICGAYSDRRFVNLDGLINSWEFKTSYRDTGRIAEFINQVQRVDYVADYVRYGDRGFYEYHNIRGVDFSDWYVIRAKWMHRQTSDLRRLVFLDVYADELHMVLSRRPPGEPVPRYAERLARLSATQGRSATVGATTEL